MELHKIEKQKLLSEPLSGDALKLIRAIYYTHLELDQDLDLEIKLQTVEHLFKLNDNESSVQYIIKLLEEINEPLLVQNFKFYREVYPIKLLVFCTYTIKDHILYIQISEEFLLAEKEYMLDSFLSH